jgi:polysaccharide export outer membrane protein
MSVYLRIRFACLAVAGAFLAGCHSGPHHHHAPEPLPVAPPEIPRELDKVSLPDYIIEPPDVLTINGINLLPKSPYRLNPLDVLTVNTIGLPEGLDLAGQFAIQPDGEVQLGYLLGGIKIAGLTVDEAREQIRSRLDEVAQDADVWIQLENIAPIQQIIGEHLVAPDGRVNLGSYGRVRVVGLTVEEAARAIERHLEPQLESPKVSVDVFGYNSKVYYVITQGASLGDQVIILPYKGNETALDAIGQIEGLTAVSSTQMWLARPGFRAETGPKVLPIDWQAITKQADATTNYQVLPGDRIYVAQDHLVDFDNRFAKLVSPIERLMGVTLLSTNTVQRIKFFHQFNSGGNFGGF